MMYDDIYIPGFIAPTRFYGKHTIEDKHDLPSRIIDREMYRQLLRSFENDNGNAPKKKTWV